MPRGFIIVITFMQGMLLVAHYALYRFGVNTFPLLARHTTLFAIVIVVLSVSFMISMFLVRYRENRMTQFIYYHSSLWMGTFLWLLLAVGIASISKIFIPSLPVSISTYIILSSFIISFYGVYHSTNTRIVEKDLILPHLPEYWEGKKALFMSDTHYGNIRTSSNADVARIRSINPDILLMSGDFFDGPQRDFHVLADPYKTLNIKHGKFIVTGNHEAYAGLEKCSAAFTHAGFTLLDDVSILIEGIRFTGIPYTTTAPSTVDSEATRKATTTDMQVPHIVLKHVPIGTDILAEGGISFAFFGHTHLGQMWPFSYIVKSIYEKHAYGMTKKGNTYFYTSSGVGTWGPPQRIGTNSEMLLLTFRKTNS